MFRRFVDPRNGNRNKRSAIRYLRGPAISPTLPMATLVGPRTAANGASVLCAGAGRVAHIVTSSCAVVKGRPLQASVASCFPSPLSRRRVSR